MSIMPELVQSALSALRHLQPPDRATAVAILGMWVHGAEIDIERVVDYYFTAGQPADRPAAADGRTWNADYRDGYAAGYVDCARVKTQMDLERSRPAGSLEESRERLVESSLSALVTVGMLSEESAGALVSLWYRRDCLTPVELDALRVAAEQS